MALKKTREEVEEETISTSDTLALRHRPRTLDEVVGQEHVKKTLAGVFKSERVPNAFMLFGTTGVGKTTLARLIGRYLNCAKRNACGKCESCKNMNAGAHPDYLEVNASEAGNIETVRKLIESARYIPSFRLRIFMLDEIHRASHAAIQALLVPVETPPSKTLWIFSTSEPSKIPNGKALIGRCQILSLRTPEKKDVATRVMEVGKREGMKWLTEKAAATAAEYSGGHVRNALQILERASLTVEGSSKTPKPKEIAKLMEDVSMEASGDDMDVLAFQLLLGIYKKDAKKAVEACLNAPDPVTLLGRAVFVNSNASMLHLVGKHEKLWRSKAVMALQNAVKKNKTLEMSQITVELLKIREELFTMGQNHPMQLATARISGLGMEN